MPGLRVMIAGIIMVIPGAWAGIVEYTVTSTPAAGGLIFPSGTVKVGAGSTPTFFIIPNDTYSVEDVKVNGSSIGSLSEVSLGPVNANQTLTATFTKSPAITASAGAGGTISPPGKQVVGFGGSRTFLVLATPGYRVKTVMVNGVGVALPLPAPSMFIYQVANIAKASTINATFALDPTKAVITATAGAGGTISPLGKTAVLKGDSKAYTITRAANYRILDVKLDGKSVGATTVFTVSNVQAAHAIAATFAKLPVITAKQAGGGLVKPEGVTVVGYGGSLNYLVTPEAGYQVAGLVINGKAAAAASSHTFSNVTASGSISATFKLQASYVLVTATAGTGGRFFPRVAFPWRKVPRLPSTLPLLTAIASWM
ncbi:MAG: hypothetical protein JWO94_3132 [Verrucomicrobiaceae bacterium]|nr:hypothetical protein [Verrucomicrobiaceae bacterium]